MARQKESDMSQYESTAAFIRLLIHATVARRLINDEALERVERSRSALNPIDEDLSEFHYVFRKRFDELLAQGLDWTSIQNEATVLRKDLAEQRERRDEARELTRLLHANTVPVMVDALRAGRLVRLNYFCIECDTPRPGWALNLADASFPFLLLGLSGVILCPFDSLTFDTPNQIDGLFERLEGELGFSVAIGDLWLPETMFREELTGGLVFRIDLKLFQQAYALRETYFKTGGVEGKSSWSAVVEQLGDFRIPEFSPVETAAFSEWSQRQIANAKEHYPKNRELALLDEGAL